MTARTTARPKGFRRFERWLIGLAFAIMAFVLEKVVLRSVRKKGVAQPTEEVTTMISKGGEVDVDLDL
jgi:hypothetical protein